ASTKENSDPEKEDSKKRPRSPKKSQDAKSSQTETKLEEDEDEAPVTKRVRRARVKVEDDEDDTPQSSANKEAAPSSPPAKKKRSPSPKSSPRSRSSSPKPTQIKKEEESAAVEDSDVVMKEESSSESASEADSDSEEKTKVTAKARKAQQTMLQKQEKDPYPDWKPGTPVPYAALCKTFSLIELTTKRLIIMEHCSRFLRQVMRLTPDDLLPTVLLMINKLAPDYAGIELGIGESLIMKAIGETTGRSLQVIKADQKEIGDLGLVAVKSRSKQPTMFQPKALTVRGVHQGLMNIATVSGNGAQGRKVDGIKKLLSASDAYLKEKVDITKDKGGPSEAKYIIRFLEGKLRLGLADRTVLVSLAQAVVAHEAEQKGKIPST
ncbi:hypothetical protein BBK36DRAFT_1083746, partial [Trichoderma citrinoviride]